MWTSGLDPCTHGYAHAHSHSTHEISVNWGVSERAPLLGSPDTELAVCGMQSALRTKSLAWPGGASRAREGEEELGPRRELDTQPLASAKVSVLTP